MTKRSPAEALRRYWFVGWLCGCSDVEGSPEALDRRCPHHDSEAELGCPVEITFGVSTDLGHMCKEGKKNWRRRKG